MFSQSQTLVMGFSQGVEASPSSKAAKQEDKQTCLPVTIRAIEGALEQSGRNGGDIRIHGAEHGMLVLVAAIESLTKQAASMEFSLTDGTGRIKARHYIAEGQSKILDDISIGRYVSVFGNVRTSPTPHFVATGMNLVKSADEVSYHMIESAHAALKLQRGVTDPTTPSPKKMSSASLQDSSQTNVMPTSQKQPIAAQHLPAVASPSSATLEGPALKSAILAFLRQDADSHPEGSSLESLFAHTKSTPADRVRKTMEQLVDDGDIFTTIDDEHFSCV